MQRRGDVPGAHRHGDGRARRRLAHVHEDQDAQVVVGADDAVQKRDDRERSRGRASIAAWNDEQLAEEAGRRRNAREREEEQRERERRRRVPLADAGRGLRSSPPPRRGCRRG